MAAPLDNLIVAINAANVRLNGVVETLVPTGGQLSGNTNSYSQQAVNSAYRKMQNRLADLRYSGLQGDTVFLAIPALSGTDPATTVSIGYDGYYDGATTVAAPALPATLLRPYELTERINGSGGNFLDMDNPPWSLPRVKKLEWNGQWLWRDNAIWMPGAVTVTDIAMTYGALLPDFLDDALLPWFNQPIPILNAVDALADYICCEIKIAQNDPSAIAFQASAEDKTGMILNQDTASGKSVLKGSQYQQMASRFTPNTGADTQTVKR